MKRILILLILFSLKSYGQSEFATIYIYRPAMSYGSMANHHIKINDRETATLKNGGYLVYKVYNETALDIAANAKAMSVPSISMTHLNVVVEKGKTYYIKLYPKFVTVGLEILDAPISEEKLKKNRVEYADDLGVVKTHSEWTENTLVSHWENKGIQKIEGIYQKVGTQADYKVAIVNESDTYSIISLSGSTFWKEGDVIAKLKKTANYGVLIATWFLNNDSKDIIINIENGIFSALSEDGTNEEKYVKVFPNYEEAKKSE